MRRSATRSTPSTRWMLGSDYWKTGMKDYGVGAGTAKGKLV